MAKKNITEIRRIINANCGGYQSVSDAVIMRKWKRLSDETQKQYTENAKVKTDDS